MWLEKILLDYFWKSQGLLRVEGEIHDSDNYINSTCSDGAEHGLKPFSKGFSYFKVNRASISQRDFLIQE